MDRGTGDRGVSEVVGFILIFGMLVISFTVYQGIVVPSQNRQVEFQHNQEVQGEFQELRNAIIRTAATGSGEAVSITLGATYPDRTIAQNLGVSAGAVETSDPGGGIRIANVRASDDETRDYLDGEVGPFETATIQYTPVYSFYSGAPTTTYENTFAYNQFPSTNLTITDQVFVDGRRITLIAVDGNLSAARRGTVSISTEAVSVSSNRVVVSNTTGAQINLTLPTRLNATVWEEILADEMGASGNVSAVSDVPGMDAVNVTLEQGETYELRLAKVAVGGSASEEPAAYLTDVSGNGSTVSTGATRELVVEVRDRYNNPVSGVDVSVAGVTGGGAVEPSNSKRSDGDGRASFTYTAPSADGSESVTFSIDDGSVDRETVTFSITVQGASGSGGSGSGGGAYDVRWQTPSGDPGLQPGCDAVDCTWDVDANSAESLTLSAETDPDLVGIEVDFAVNDSAVAAIQTADVETDSNGLARTDIQAGSNGVVGVYVISGGSSDLINLTVTGIDLEYLGNARASSGTNANLNSVVDFSFANARTDQITITGITIEESSSGVQIQETDPSLEEVMIDTNGDGNPDGTAEAGFAPSQFDVGEDIDLDTDATLSSGGTAAVTLYEFQNNGDNPVDMSGEVITVTIHYEDPDGNPDSRTFTLPIE